MLETDTGDYSRVEKQYCLGGEWTTYIVYDTANDRARLYETVEEPLSLNLKLDARSFFELENYDPYAIVEAFRVRVARGIELASDEKAAARLDLASAKTQALLERQGLTAKESCRTRSVPFSQAILRFAGGWLPPESNGFPGQSQVTYDIASDVPAAARLAILNAIDQYHFAVTSQDSALHYPTEIVPRDSADSRPATIHFAAMTDTDSDAGIAETVIDKIPVHVFGAEHRWVSGEIRINVAYLALIDPAAIGHEIGHVMGLDHLPAGVAGSMRPNAERGPSQPWTPESRQTEPRNVAFDACMFLPAERPLL